MISQMHIDGDSMENEETGSSPLLDAGLFHFILCTCAIDVWYLNEGIQLKPSGKESKMKPSVFLMRWSKLGA